MIHESPETELNPNGIIVDKYIIRFPNSKRLGDFSKPLIMNYALRITNYLLSASLTATAKVSVIPTIGLLPLTMN